MSKSKGNVVSPEAIIDQFGADTARLFILFAAPPERDLEWNDSAVEGCYRFLNRVYRLVTDEGDTALMANAGGIDKTNLTKADKTARRAIHSAIKRVTDDISGRFNFNTAISAIMEMVNALYAYKTEADVKGAILKEGKETLVLLLAPFAPHIAEELWQELGYNESVHKQSWCGYDPEALVLDEVEIAIQINGKVKDRMMVAADSTADSLLETVKTHEKFAEWTGGKDIVKIVPIPGKLVNIVVK